MNTKLNKMNLLVIYYDKYKNFLTNRQREIFEYYYFDDLSMVEIGKKLNISRAAVNDSLKTTEKILEKYDKKLKN